MTLLARDKVDATARNQLKSDLLSGYDKTAHPFNDVHLVYELIYLECPLPDPATATIVSKLHESQVHNRPYLIHDLLFLPISTIESAVGKRLITHCCVSRLACSRSNGHIEPHLPDFKREINTTTTVMN